MSSLSLPRVLQQRKTSLELERENFEKFQAASISKAINSIESPVKEKHVRSTFRDKSPELFWQIVLKLPLQDNRITAWKFCHVLHKILRDGHPQTIPLSLKYKNRIVDLGKLWCHLKEGYGKLIQQYCQLLLVKLDFHAKNPGFPGNLVLTAEELDKIGGNDIDNYFQMSVEMFDYIDEILSLQEAIFGSLDMSRSNSMTSSGQCRLAPLIQCIQDSSQLYDYCVRILFKLYAQLPADVLFGHRIPLLPENPPNILVQAELRTYVTPVVILPQDEPDGSQISSDLIDVSSESSQNCSRSMSPDLIAQRDSLIEQLQNELSGFQSLILQLKRKIISLEEQLLEKDEEVSKLKIEHSGLLKQLEEFSKISDSEEKVKILEEKFNKLKDVYSKLREEHIQLIRQKAGIEKALKGSDKMTKFARAANNLIVSIKADVDKQLASVKNIEFEIAERTKLEEELATLQATADAANEQNEALVCKMEWTIKEKALLESKLQECNTSKSEFISKLKETEARMLKTENFYFESCQKILKKAIAALSSHMFHSVSCSIDDLEIIKNQILSVFENENKDVFKITYSVATLMLFGKAVSNSIPDLEIGERMINMLKEIGCDTKEKIEFIRKQRNDSNYHFIDLQEKINQLTQLYRSIEHNNAAETLSDLVENELATMDTAIEEAAIRIESHSISAKEFYKRNHQWTEGLISAAKAVGMGAKYLLVGEVKLEEEGRMKKFSFADTAADDVINGVGKLERLIVASQGVAASTAQLVVASRVKADRNSINLIALSVASKEVTQATGHVVATVKSCAQLVEESDDLDFSGLSLHQAKRLEMDSQVRVLELEAGLEKERLRLATLRRYHYQLSGDTDKN
ncbi:hypothetical protein PGB90_003991 [Kerria lacca]